MVNPRTASVATEPAHLDGEQPRSKKPYVSSLGSLQHLERITPLAMCLLQDLKENARVNVDDWTTNGHEAPP